MATLSRDTSEETERVLLDLLRKKSTAERIHMAASLTACIRALVKNSLKQRYPSSDDQELRCRFAALWLGREWAVRVYGWDPEQHGW